MKNLVRAIFLPVAVLYLFVSCTEKKTDTSAHWQKADDIVASITIPVFPETTYSVADFGAKSDSSFDSLPAIQEAIDKCSSEGGGKVVVPAGTYYSAGPIVLKDNVNLHFEDNATINFSTTPEDYLPVVLTRWEGVECYNYSSLIYANGVKNIALTGKGILNGKASNENWWLWKGLAEYGWTEDMPHQGIPEGRPTLLTMNNTSVPLEERVFGEGSYLRPNFFQTINCENILIEDVTFIDSPMWFIHPVLSNNITIRGVRVVGKGPNNDGCDPESSKNILIEDCLFDTGDDCIAIKSGRNNDGRRINIPSENIVVRNCKMRDGHGGIVIGSEISGGCKNVFAEDCVMDSPNLDRALRIKTNYFRGGTVENIFMRNVEVGQVAEAIVKINLNYDIKNEDGDHFDPVVRNVYVENVSSSKSDHAFHFDGLESSPIENVYIINSKLNGVEKESVIKNVNNLVVEDVYINEKLFKN